MTNTSLWADTAAAALTPPPQRAPLPASTTVDVVIVGAGYTGLWTALELRRRDPHLRIMVLDSERVGFGASGRNGGWCSSLLPMSLESVEAVSSRSEAVRLQRAMYDTVDEIGRQLDLLGIDAHYAKAGWMHGACNPAQAKRLHAELATEQRYGLHDSVWLSRQQASDQIAVPGLLGAVFTPHCAVIHPARLVHGLAAAVESAGVTIHERTRVRSLDDRAVTTDHGTVRADVVVRATEAFTSTLSGMRRDLAPIYSLMIATEPLGSDVWDQIGWRTRMAYNDARHSIIYAQRTADDRIAIGGRGTPYHFGSRVKPEFDSYRPVHDQLAETLARLFPAAASARITHRWGGAVAAPRDWFASVGFDRTSGLAWAGGYVGDGVATSNLAGRTLADLICGLDSDLTSLPWVGHQSKRWEPEPFRWIGVNAALRSNDSLDRVDNEHRKAPLRSRIIDKLVG